jgi:hypothetical protein
MLSPVCTVAVKALPIPVIGMQLSDVDEDHDSVEHGCLPIVAVGVVSAVAKFKPHTVVCDFPSIGPFGGRELVSAGASYVKTEDKVSKNTATPTLEGMVTPMPAPTPTPAPTTQARPVVEVQDVDAHADAPTTTVGEVLSPWKPKPVTPSTVAPEVAAFAGEISATSIVTSKEKHAMHGLPLLSAINIVESIATFDPGGVVHAIDVALSHEDVLHIVAEPPFERSIVGERSPIAKFTPATVIDADPDGGLFPGVMYENSGPSKVNSAGEVPASEPTKLTYEFSCERLMRCASPTPIEVAHRTVLLVTHTVVAHTLYRVAFSELSFPPKFMPKADTKLPPVTGWFVGLAHESRGASNENENRAVAIAFAMVTATFSPYPTPGGVWQIIEEPEIHMVVEHGE